MSDTGTQKSLPFPSHPALNGPPDTHFRLVAARSELHQKIEAIQRLISYQGRNLAALYIIDRLKDEEIRDLTEYIATLESALEKMSRKVAKQ